MQEADIIYSQVIKQHTNVKLSTITLSYKLQLLAIVSGLGREVIHPGWMQDDVTCMVYTYGSSPFLGIYEWQCCLFARRRVFDVSPCISGSLAGDHIHTRRYTADAMLARSYATVVDELTLHRTVAMYSRPIETSPLSSYITNI